MSNNPLTQSMRDFGVTFTPANVEQGQEYWACISADGPLEWGGRHAIYLDALGKDGQRAIGTPVLFWNGGESPRVTEAKPGEPFALDLPMFAKGNAYSVRINDGRPSDTLAGMGLLAWERHVAFQLVFQLSVAAQEPGTQPPIIVPPDPPMTAREAIGYARFYLDMAEKLLLALTLLLLLSASGCVWKPTTLEAKPFEYDHDWMQMRPL